MVLLRVFAVFWTADIIDEKNPDAGFPGETGGPPSGVGVKGAGVMLDSLLGPRPVELALPRRCWIMLPGEALVCGGDPAGASLAGVNWNVGWLWSVGVGGVLTMTGVALSPAGGVCGRWVVSTFWPRERRRIRSEDATFVASVCFLGDSLAWASGLGKLVAEAEDVEARSKSVAAAILRSGLELAALAESLLLPVVLFFGLNASLSRPTGDGDRLALNCGGARPVLLVTRGGANSRPSALGRGKLDELRGAGSDGDSSGGCDSNWCVACTAGEEVVK